MSALIELAAAGKSYGGVPYMISGELEVALVLSIPTIGPLMFDSLNQQDVFVTSTILLILSVVLVVGNLLADLALAALGRAVHQGCSTLIR